jgi:hypothetical protein
MPAFFGLTSEQKYGFALSRFPDVEFHGLLGITIRLGIDASFRLMQSPARVVKNE